MKFRIKRKKRKAKRSIGWDYHKDGLSSSFILSWLSCKEKANFDYIELLKATPKGGSALRFGDFFHKCLELVQSGQTKLFKAYMAVDTVLSNWQGNEGKFASVEMHQSYEDTAAKAEALLVNYVDFWAEEDEAIEWIAIEQYFNVPFLNTRLCGLFDGVIIDGNGAVWLFETKTRAKLDVKVSTESLTFDLQTQLYLLALRFWLDSIPEYYGKRIAGVKYNVIRKVQLKQKQKETELQFETRVANDIAERPEFYFKRIENACGEQSNRAWATETLTPIIKAIEQWALKKDLHYRNVNACQDKFGLCNYFPICARNDRTGYKVKTRPYEHHPITITV